MKRLVSFFEIDPLLISAASEQSPDVTPLQEVDFAPLIVRLTRQECDEFLPKIVNEELGAVAALRKKTAFV